MELNIETKKNIVAEIIKCEKSLKDICNEFNISYHTYLKIKKEHNLPLKKQVRKSKHNINHDFFNVIDTEEKAYWLGFLYADGNVHKKGEYHTVTIALSIVDIKHIEKFRKSIKTDYKIGQYKNNNYEYCKIECCSKKMFNDLCKLGCVERKTLVLEFPTYEQVPEHLMHHFMRGYFDGDGTINSHKEVGNKRNQVRFQIVGTENFLNGYLKELSKIGVGLNSHLQNTKAVKTLQICGNKQTKILFDYLYKDATIYLDRKHDKYIEYFYK